MERQLPLFCFFSWFCHSMFQPAPSDTLRWKTKCKEPGPQIFTVHKRSCGKVMFSQACVKNSSHEGEVHPPPRQTPSPLRRLLQRTVRIILECILVFITFGGTYVQNLASQGNRTYQTDQLQYHGGWKWDGRTILSRRNVLGQLTIP